MMKRQYLTIFFGFLFALIVSGQAFAQTGIEDISENIVDSTEFLPGLVTAVLYLIGLLLGVWGILKIKEHVDNPNQTPLRVGVIRLIVGGAMFAMPIVYEAVQITINGGSFASLDIPNLYDQNISAILGGVSALLSGGTNINAIFNNIRIFSDEVPGLIGALSYLLALLLGAIGVLKIKDHVEDPDRTHVKEGVIRLLIAGALLTLPTVFDAMYTTINGSGAGLWGTILGVFTTWSFLNSSDAPGFLHCGAAMIGLGSTVGDVICNSFINSAGFPAFLTGIAYVLGLIFGVWGLLKIRDHVLNPAQVGLSEGVTRLLAGGAFFALPAVMTALYSTLTPAPLVAVSTLTTTTTYNESFTCLGTNSLDEAMACFMDDVMGPTHIALNFFGYVAGMIFIMIGISRLIKSAQEGPKGPGGVGTVATFVTGGLLISASAILRAFSSSMFGSPITLRFANLSYTTGMTLAETQAAYNVISAVLKFMVVVGLISFVRGLFIMREVSEGNQQASAMSGMTHIIGGALAVNLGPVLNAVQSTLGITTFGVSFGI